MLRPGRWDELGLLSLSLDFAAVQAHARSLLGREEFQLRFTGGTQVGAPMTLAEPAAAARMSPRGLQAASARHFEATPMGRLRSLRLTAAHAELGGGRPFRWCDRGRRRRSVGLRPPGALRS
ncbi:hypothetical protein [Kocuria sediminis]|uniref:hypothetical protein n=1 Tax=Kocuria sediminis TaxID=1038857 RepID=UPI001F0FF701|nr:hypothetical protein [Kocuria sediminis]